MSRLSRNPPWGLVGALCAYRSYWVSCVSRWDNPCISSSVHWLIVALSEWQTGVIAFPPRTPYQSSGTHYGQNHNIGYIRGKQRSARQRRIVQYMYQWAPCQKALRSELLYSPLSCYGLYTPRTHAQVLLSIGPPYQGHSQIEVTGKNGKSMRSTHAERQVLCGYWGRCVLIPQRRDLPRQGRLPSYPRVRRNHNRVS